MAQRSMMPITQSPTTCYASRHCRNPSKHNLTADGIHPHNCSPPLLFLTQNNMLAQQQTNGLTLYATGVYYSHDLHRDDRLHKANRQASCG